MQLKRVVSIFALLFLCFASPAKADDAANQNIGGIQCEPKAGQLTQAIYECIRAKLDTMSQDMVVKIYNKTSKASILVATLAVMFFGIKFILYGTRQAQPEFVMMMLKLTIVMSLLIGINAGGGILELRDTILHAGAGIQNLVFTGGDVFGVSGKNIFEQMDNMLFKVLGIKDPQNVKMDKDLAGIGMLGGMLLAGPVGAKIFVEGGAAIGMLMGAFMVALYISIVSLIALTFLFALSPVILPMMAFTATEKIFQKWRGQIISYSLQPMIMTVFLSMMLIILSNLVGTLDNFINVSRNMSNDPGVASVKKIITTATSHTDPNKPGNDTGRGEETTPLNDQILTDAAQGLNVNPELGTVTKGIGTKDMAFNITPLDQKDLKGLGSQAVLLLIVCGAMLRFMKELPAWTAELAGGDRTVPNLAQSRPVQQIERQFESKKR